MKQESVLCGTACWTVHSEMWVRCVTMSNVAMDVVRHCSTTVALGAKRCAFSTLAYLSHRLSLLIFFASLSLTLFLLLDLVSNLVARCLIKCSSKAALDQPYHPSPFPGCGIIIKHSISKLFPYHSPPLAPSIIPTLQPC